MMRTPRIFSVGDLNIDLFTHTNAAARFGEECRARKFYYSIGGNAANFAAAAAGLGLDTFLVSAVGKDIFTPFLKQELKRLRIKPLLLQSHSQNGVSNIFVRGDGERAIVSSKGCLLEMNCAFASRKILPGLSHGDIVFFGGFFHMPKMGKGFASLLRAIRAKGAKVFFDACFDEYG